MSNHQENPKAKIKIDVIDPTLSDLMELMKKDIFLSLNCHAIGTVESFDPSVQTVTAKINYKKTYVRQKENGEYYDLSVDYPLLLDVPIISLYGGTSGLTFPIAKGDTCLILFNDRDIDNWFQSGQIVSPSSTRLHALSDGMALVGVRHFSKPLPAYDMNRAKLYHEEAMVAVGGDKVKISNSSTTLNTLLQDLLTQLQSMTVVCAAPGSPSGPPANAAALAAIASQIGGLLE